MRAKAWRNRIALHDTAYSRRSRASNWNRGRNVRICIVWPIFPPFLIAFSAIDHIAHFTELDGMVAVMVVMLMVHILSPYALP